MEGMEGKEAERKVEVEVEETGGSKAAVELEEVIAVEKNSSVAGPRGMSEPSVSDAG